LISSGQELNNRVDPKLILPSPILLNFFRGWFFSLKKPGLRLRSLPLLRGNNNRVGSHSPINTSQAFVCSNMLLLGRIVWISWMGLRLKEKKNSRFFCGYWGRLKREGWWKGEALEVCWPSYQKSYCWSLSKQTLIKFWWGF